MKNILITLSCVVLLNGCAIMSKSECQNANWEFIGQRDGVAGAAGFLAGRLHGHSAAKQG